MGLHLSYSSGEYSYSNAVSTDEPSLVLINEQNEVLYELEQPGWYCGGDGSDWEWL